MAFGRVVVVVEVVEGVPSREQADELGKLAAAGDGVAVPSVATNASKFWPELVEAGLSCTMTGVSAVMLVGGAPTGVVAVAGWVGLTTSAAQCVNGVVRSYQVIANPDGTTLEEWDKNRVYEIAMLFVDGFGLASGLVGPGKAVLAALRRYGKLESAEQLARMTKADRAAAFRRAIDRAGLDAEGRAALKAAKSEAGMGTKSLNRVVAGGGRVGRIQKGRQVIAAATAKRVREGVVAVLKSKEMKKDVAMSAVQAGISGLPQRWAGSAGGVVNKLGSAVVESVGVHVIEKPPAAAKK